MATKHRAPKTNREQRRAEEFGSSAGGAPTPSKADELPRNEAVAGRPDQDQTRLTGAGTGGATEHDGRIPRHEGTHATNSAKG